MKELVFLILTSAIIFSAIVLVFARRTVYSIFALISLYLFVSVMINYSLEMEFVSLLYILIYIGAVAILFLFIVMMVPLKDEEADFKKTLNQSFAFSNFQVIFVTLIFSTIVLNPLLVDLWSYLNTFIVEFDLLTEKTSIFDVGGGLKDIYLFGYMLYSVYSFHLILIAYFLFAVLVAILWLTQE
jgi:NADH-quinone oxidoreductase subunit J